MDVFVFILTTLILGILCAIPGIIVGRLWEARGLARSLPIPFLGTTVFLVFLFRLRDLVLPWWFYVGASIVLPLILFRFEFMATSQKGKWWWLKESEKKTSLLGWLVIAIVIAVGIVGLVLFIITPSVH